MNSLLVIFWKKLQTVREVALRCTGENLWHGFAKVFVTSQDSRSILFHEKGEWENINLSFTNALQWRLNPDGISLEHLRFGSQFPVSLVDLIPVEKNSLISIKPHLCGQDKYSARVLWNEEGIHVYWDIQGPLKNQKIHSHYT